MDANDLIPLLKDLGGAAAGMAVVAFILWKKIDKLQEKLNKVEISIARIQVTLRIRDNDENS